MSTNPYDHPRVWGSIRLGGRLLPGIIISINGAIRPYDWQIQAAQGSSGATSVYKGEKLAESIEVVIGAPRASHFNAIESLRKYIAAPKGGKPPSFVVSNPVINFNGIGKVSIKEIGQPEYVGKGSWTLKLTFLEYRPSSPVKTGPADPAKPGDPPTPANAAEKQMDDLLKKINEVG